MKSEVTQSSEIMKKPETVYSFVVMRPGGNKTALISGIIQDAAKRREINDAIMNCYPSVEQVGFISADPTAPELMMAGGEFCGNATRSTAWLALNGKPGEIAISVSGVKNRLRAGITQDGEAFAQMPVYPDIQKVTRDPENPENLIVEMEGITHYINFNTNEIDRLTPEKIKERGLALIQKKGLDRFPAAGVMYSKKNGDAWGITPVVYVPNVSTFLETACGSGTTALGLVLALQNGGSINDLPIVQPTGLPIKVSVEFDGTTFKYAQISGPVEKLAGGMLIQKDGLPYAVELERVTSPKDLERALGEGGLTSLYKEIFGESPYFESFTDKVVNDFFEEYRRDGILLLAKNQDAVIGFGAAVPLKSVPDVARVIGVPPEQCDNRWYIADLGIKKEFRRNTIGKKLTTDTVTSIQELGGTTVDLRTSINNLIALTLYRQIGFLPITGVIEEVSGLRTSGNVENDTRVFLTKKL